MLKNNSKLYNCGFYGLLLLVTLHSPQNSYAMSEVGVEVNKISLPQGVGTWHALDARHLLLSQGAKDSFLLTLAKHCVALPAAQRLGVSASNNTIYAGFDYITADGQRCDIHSINRISPETAASLKDASNKV
jgi:uncharacterized protein DUF6491